MISVMMSGGPLSYNYNFDSIYLHFGRTDAHGSEHIVAGVSFPAEVISLSLSLSLFFPPYEFSLLKFDKFLRSMTAV